MFKLGNAKHNMTVKAYDTDTFGFAYAEIDTLPLEGVDNLIHSTGIPNEIC